MIFTSHISWNESNSYLQCSYSWMWFLLAFILHIYSFCSSHQRFGGCLENITGLSFTYRQANTGTSFLTLSVLHTWNNSLTSWSKKLVFKSPPFTDELSRSKHSSVTSWQTAHPPCHATKLHILLAGLESFK